MNVKEVPDAQHGVSVELRFEEKPFEGCEPLVNIGFRFDDGGVYVFQFLVGGEIKRRRRLLHLEREEEQRAFGVFHNNGVDEIFAFRDQRPQLAIDFLDTIVQGRFSDAILTIDRIRR